jgi:hypothetical protein
VPTNRPAGTGDDEVTPVVEMGTDAVVARTTRYPRDPVRRARRVTETTKW